MFDEISASGNSGGGSSQEQIISDVSSAIARLDEIMIRDASEAIRNILESILGGEEGEGNPFISAIVAYMETSAPENNPILTNVNSVVQQQLASSEEGTLGGLIHAKVTEAINTIDWAKDDATVTITTAKWEATGDITGKQNEAIENITATRGTALNMIDRAQDNATVANKTAEWQALAAIARAAKTVENRIDGDNLIRPGQES